MLIVVKHRDIHDFPQLAFDKKAFRRLDVFQVDPAKDGPRCCTQLTNSSTSSVLSSRSIESTSAKRLNSTAFPSITGRRHPPRLPSPRTAQPFDIATMFLAVIGMRLPGHLRFLARRRDTRRGQRQSRCVVSGLVATTSTLPGRPDRCIARESLSRSPFAPVMLEKAFAVSMPIGNAG